MKQFHYIYKIISLKGEQLAGKYYIGKRTTRPWQDPYNDGYYGSGTIVKSYYKKYPPVEGETIIKEIIEFNPDKKTNAEREKYWVGDKYKTDPLCVNLKGGGDDGCEYSEEARQKISQKLTGIKRDTTWNKGKHGCYSEATIQRLRDSHKGKKNTPEAIEKQKEGIKKWYNNLTEEEKKALHKKRGDAEKRKVNQILGGVIIKTWDSGQDIQNELGIAKGAISRCCHHKYGCKSAGGFQWEFA